MIFSFCNSKVVVWIKPPRSFLDKLFADHSERDWWNILWRGIGRNHQRCKSLPCKFSSSPGPSSLPSLSSSSSLPWSSKHIINSDTVSVDSTPSLSISQNQHQHSASSFIFLVIFFINVFAINIINLQHCHIYSYIKDQQFNYSSREKGQKGLKQFNSSSRYKGQPILNFCLYSENW